MWFLLRLLPIGPVLVVVFGALAAQSLGVDVAGIATDFILDLLGAASWDDLLSL